MILNRKGGMLVDELVKWKQLSKSLVEAMRSADPANLGVDRKDEIASQIRDLENISDNSTKFKQINR